MPTLLTIFGIRFYFYLDEHLPIHVHISCGGKKAKVVLEPEIELVYNHGLKEQEMKKALDTCFNVLYTKRILLVSGTRDLDN